VLDPQADSGILHAFLRGLELKDQVTGFVIETFVKLVHGFREVLDGFNELRIHRDAGAEGSKSGHLCQHTRVAEPLQGLVHCEVEWDIPGKYVKIAVLDAWGFHQ